MVLFPSLSMARLDAFPQPNPTVYVSHLYGHYTVCPLRYQTHHFLNNSNTNEDIGMKFEQAYVRCVRNENECVCSVCVYCF